MRIAIPLDPSDSKVSLNMAYVEYVTQAGYDPMPVVPQNDAMDIAKLCDGLLLPGGKDIDPIFYGESNWGSFWADSAKDDFERQLFWAFINYGKPIFGICRGFQLIAREYIHATGSEKVTPAADETIEERLVFQQDIGSHDCAGRYNLFRSRAHHYVDGREDHLYGSDDSTIKYMAVNSMHHQYLHLNVDAENLIKTNKVTPHMRATAWTTRGLTKEEAGVVCEALLIKGWTKSRIAGVQWHPEELKDYALLHHHFGKSKTFRGPELAARATR
jgi:gamma-glutamyl-gamma-aminobutyrate hydrolase PuuD